MEAALWKERGSLPRSLHFQIIRLSKLRLDGADRCSKTSRIHFRHTVSGLALTPCKRGAPILGSPIMGDGRLSPLTRITGRS